MNVYVVEAGGGEYDDSWTRPICVCKTYEEAGSLVDNLVKWLDEIRGMELPESLQDYNFEDNEDDQIRRDIALSEYKNVIMSDMGIPEELHEWFEEQWDSSYCCDKPYYNVTEVVML